MTAALEMSASASSARTSEEKTLDESLSVLQDNAKSFARLGIPKKIELLKETMDRLLDVAGAWSRDGLQAKGLPPTDGEEMIAGVVPTMRNLRLLTQTLEKLQRAEPLITDKMLKTRADGRVEVEVFPTDAMDAALFTGFSIKERMDQGLDPATVKMRAASFYKEAAPEGGVSLILGAGNVSSIPPTDALYKSFAEGYVCMVKMNPVNEWVGPHIEYAFKPFIDRGYLKVCYGAGDVGAYLVQHDAVEDIHITGSNHTHDRIVWGPEGEERERRMKANDPVLKKRITSELGNVSPVAIVPAHYSEKELEFIAQNITAMITNNGSFNCNAAKMLITARGWAQKEALLQKINRALSASPLRRAYYPGAHSRYEKLTKGRDQLTQHGELSDTHLPWTLIRDVDSAQKDDPLFSTEPFCAILSHTELKAQGPAEFLNEATYFMNQTLWGTLNAMIIIPPKLERASEVSRALDQAVTDLRYGTVAINHWPALVFATISPAWGGHPSSTLANAQSGIGWVHNTYLLEGIEKSILRGPLTVFPKPAWFGSNRNVLGIASKLLQVEHSPSWLKVPGVVVQALQG